MAFKAVNHGYRLCCFPITRKWAGTLGLVLTVTLVNTSCASLKKMTRTITPNEYSERVGEAQVKADEEECFQFGMGEKRRLLNELLLGDPTLAGHAARESSAENFGRTLSDMEGGSTAAGSAAAALTGFLFSSWDSESYDERGLARYLGIEGGLGDGFSATVRLRNACLRAQGYMVEKYQEDGTRTEAYLEWNPTRAMLRGEDGSEVVFYDHAAN